MTLTPRRIYVASSWRNEHQPPVVAALREAGHEVYDFRNPAPGNTGFGWSSIDPDWPRWTPERFAELVHTHPVAIAGFGHDKRALDWCDTCVLVLPCGRSAHLEAGYAAGQGKQVFFLLHPDRFEPELMYELGSGYACSVEELLPKLRREQRPSLTETGRERMVRLAKLLRGRPLYEGYGEQSDLPEQVADQVDRMLLELDDWRELWRSARDRAEAAETEWCRVERALGRAEWAHTEGAMDRRTAVGNAPGGGE